MIVLQGNVWSKIDTCTEQERQWLDEYTSVEIDGRYMWRPDGVEFDPSAPPARYRMLHEISGTFPSGFTAMLPKAAAAAGFHVQVEDKRGPPPCLVDDFADLDWLRPYQRDAVWFATEAGRGLIKVPTAGGKTEIFVGLTRTLPCEWLFTVHRTDLTGQAADRYALRTGETAGVFAGGKWTRGSANVTVATFQGIYAAMQKARKAKDKKAEVWSFLKAIQALNVDECFPPGTLVDETPIEQLRVGDDVTAFDPETCTTARRRVVRVLRKTTDALVKITLVSGRAVVTTPTHKIWTAHGWQRAGELTGGQSVRCLPTQHESSTLRSVSENGGDPYHEQRARALLPGVPSGEAGGAQGGDALHGVRCASGGVDESAAGTVAGGTGLLLRRPQARVVGADGVAAVCCSGSMGHAGEPGAGGGENARAEPHARPGGEGQGGDEPAGGRLAPADARRERDGTDRSTAFACEPVGLADGGCRSYRWPNRRKATHALQDRHRGADVEGGDRSRRCESQYDQQTRGGPTEGHVLGWDRVDRIEVLEPGGDGGYGGLCPGGVVYDLEVEDLHTYFAGGVAVSNCHAVPAGTFYKVTMALPNCYYRFGQSGTPLDRGPRDSLRTIGAMGPMVYKIKSEVLRQAGVLSEATVYMIECKQAGTTHATWQETYSQLVVNSDVRNSLVAAMAERAAKPCLLFIDQVAQGYDLVKRLNRLGLQADVCYGDAPKEQRKRKIKTLVQGKLDVLVCSVIFQEGIDIPELASVVNGGGKASTVGVLQRMGRGMRIHASKNGFECWDVLDRSQKWLQKHAAARLAAYRKENHTVVLGWPPDPPKQLTLADL